MIKQVFDHPPEQNIKRMINLLPLVLTNSTLQLKTISFVLENSVANIHLSYKILRSFLLKSAASS